MNVWPEQRPDDGMQICVSTRFGGLRAGTYSGGYVAGDGLPDGYISLSKGDRWVELPDWMKPGYSQNP